MAKIRTKVTPINVDKAFRMCREKMYSRLDKKGWDGFIGAHECGGVIQEEVFEMWDEIRKNNKEGLRSELVDVAVAAIFALASMEAQDA